MNRSTNVLHALKLTFQGDTVTIFHKVKITKRSNDSLPNRPRLSKCAKHLSMSTVVQPVQSFLFFFIGNVDKVQHRIDIGCLRRKLKLTR